MDRLHPTDERTAFPRCRCRPVGTGSDPVRLGHDLGCGQLHHHRGVPARTRHDDVPDADLHLEHTRDLGAGTAGVPDLRGRVGRAGLRSTLRWSRVRPGDRGSGALAAPVLVLRPSRGLHRRAPVLRHRLRNLPGLQPQTHLRLQGPDLRHPRHRSALDHGVGAPHVRHRSCSAAVLFVHVLPHRRADRGEVVQLDRHHVARTGHPGNPDAVQHRGF